MADGRGSSVPIGPPLSITAFTSGPAPSTAVLCVGPGGRRSAALMGRAVVAPCGRAGCGCSTRVAVMRGLVTEAGASASGTHQAPAVAFCAVPIASWGYPTVGVGPDGRPCQDASAPSTPLRGAIRKRAQNSMIITIVSL